MPRAASMTYSGKPPVAACSQVRAGFRERLPGNSLSETRRIGGLQRAEMDLGEQPGSLHPDDPACELGVFVEVVLAQCRGHQEPGIVA